MHLKIPKKVQTGDAITARDRNEIVDLLRVALINPSTSSGIRITQGPDGTSLVVPQANNGFLAITNGAITSRSGTTAGSGYVYLVTCSQGSLTTTSVEYSVINPSSTTTSSGHGIDSGKYCWVQKDQSGNLIVFAMEC